MLKFLLLLAVTIFIQDIRGQSVDSLTIKQVDSLIQVSRKLMVKGDFNKAHELSTAAEKLAFEKLGEESEAYGSCAFNLGRVLFYKGDYVAAERWYLKTKAIREKLLGVEHPNYARCLHYLGILYRTMNNVENAERFLLEAKAIRENVLGKEHPDYAQSLSSLANLFWTMGDFKKAEPLYIEAKAIYEKILGNEHPDYARSLYNLAVLYYDMGNFEKTELLCLEAAAIQEKVQGKENLDYAKSTNLLAVLYHDMGNFEKAEPLYIQAIAITVNVLGKEHPEYANGLNNLAVLYDDMGNFEKAEPLYMEAKAIYEKVLGKEHPEYASSPNNLGNLYYQMGQFEKAEPLHLEAKAIREKVLGKQHPDYSWSLINLARLYERQIRFFDSEPLLEEAFFLSQTRLLNATSFLSEVELAKFANTFQNSGGDLCAFLFARAVSREQAGILPILAYDHALFYKGFLLTAAAWLHSNPNNSPESAEINLRLKSYRRRLAAEYVKPIAERKNVPELEESANIAEKELARSVIGYSEAIRQVKWHDVQETLKQTDAAIEFVTFKVNFPKMSDSIIYAALLVKPGTRQPVFIPLFEEKSLDSLLLTNSDRKADYVNNLYALADRGMVQSGSEKKSLYELLWKPMEKEFVGIQTIYFSPAGLLHRINLGAIPVSETETLADRYRLVEMNSTRQLVIPDQVTIANKDASLYGGIFFEQDTTIENNDRFIASRSSGELSFSSVDSTLRGGSWNYLAGTEREINVIQKTMISSGVNVTLNKGYEATEQSFKHIGANNTPSPKIVHIATHGYFFPDPVGRPPKGGGRLGEVDPIFKISDHPMLRSGLIMAAGNDAWQGKQTQEGKEDGILTAYEISQMNLSNTELVVLSACETGLGDIRGNEGVYGLQRAFKIAGAKYLIMSLWQVPDKQTSLLMTTFYKKWLEDKLTIPDAFHAAQKELRDIGLDPYQWAGFVLVE